MGYEVKDSNDTKIGVYESKADALTECLCWMAQHSVGCVTIYDSDGHFCGKVERGK